MSRRGKEYEIAFKLNGELESSFKRSFGDANDSIRDIEKELRQLSNSNHMGRFDRDIQDAERSLRNLDRETDGFGNTLKRVAEYTGAYHLITTAAESLTDLVGTTFEYEGSLKQLQAATGQTVEEMQAIETSMKNLYNQNIGESFTDLTETLSTVQQITDQTGGTLENTAKQAIVFRDVFKEDVPESIKTVDTLMKQFGTTSEDAYDLLAQGAQNGLNKSNELLDSANEYAPHFAALGFSANEMFDMFGSGLEAGAFNLDKIGDLVKEFNIKSTDGSKATIEAFEELNMDAQSMMETIGSGGPEAEKAFDDIVNSILSVQDSVKQNEIGFALMGTPFEDLELTVFESMTNVRSQFDQTKDTMEEIAAVKYDTVGHEYEKLGHQLMTGIILPYSEELLPVLKDAAEWMIENQETLELIGLAVPAAILGKSVVGITKGFQNITSSILGATSTAGKFGAASLLLTNPVGIAATAVGGLAFGVMAYKKHQEEARQALINMGDDLEVAIGQYEEVTEKTGETRELVTEYQNLSEAVRRNVDPSKDLTVEKERLAELEQILHDMYPDTISNYDIESGRIKDKIDLLDEEIDREERLARIRLEQEASSSYIKIPELTSEISDLEKGISELETKGKELKPVVDSFGELYLQLYDVMQMEPSQQNDNLIQEILNKANNIGRDHGYKVAYPHDFEEQMERLSGDYEELISNMNEKSEELYTAENSLESLYKAQKSIIEMDLGGSIEEQAKAYKELTKEEKSRFEQAISDIEKLNDEMDLLEDYKKIDIDVVVNEKLNSMYNGQFGAVTSQYGQLNGYAEGGMITRPELAWIGEGGDTEMVLPMNNKPRSHALLDTANQMMGRGGGGNNIYLTYSPNQTIYSDSNNVQVQAERALKNDRDSLMAQLEEIAKDQERLVYE
ncbi:phage tail tape measure protein [Chengkuizengella axinellae]|uniref:Phage tail tape measure protein n=1 Tax=Chengkuizengella axinellae TaxID=3064388 RepID=A0ABT9J699_9BACL|nr:phage tail tape measure protein [Chengkuizengella sp. 2205SS18-9]MDP5277141.1 phage tail tape measure protein [Chengkuizengella sp. 2205SS18-9]